MSDEQLDLFTSKCSICGKNPATLLCDGTLPRWLMVARSAVKGGSKSRAMLKEKLNGRALTEVPTSTCDRPMCKECAYSPDGPIFFCGKDGGIETRDYCPECAKWKYQHRSHQHQKWTIKPIK